MKQQAIADRQLGAWITSVDPPCVRKCTNGSGAGTGFHCFRCQKKPEKAHHAFCTGAAKPERHISCWQVVKDDGLRGFYRGCTTNLVRTTPAAALTFTSYELIAERMRAHGRNLRGEEATRLRQEGKPEAAAELENAA